MPFNNSPSNILWILALFPSYFQNYESSRRYFLQELWVSGWVNLTDSALMLGPFLMMLLSVPLIFKVMNRDFRDLPGQELGSHIDTQTPDIWQNDTQCVFCKIFLICWVQGNISKVSLIQEHMQIKWCKEANIVLLCQYIGLIWLYSRLSIG